MRILIVDNCPLHIRGLLTCLTPLSIVSSIDQCSIYEELRRKLEENKPDIVFLELNLGTQNFDGFMACREIVQNHQNVCVAVLSRYNSEECIKKAQRCGACAYFDKHCEGDYIGDFLHAFAQGSVEEFHIKVVKERKQGVILTSADEFELRQYVTGRQGEVMKMIVGGMAPKDIRSKLGISAETFRSHHNAILSRLNVKNDVELTKFALLHKLIDEDASNGSGDNSIP